MKARVDRRADRDVIDAAWRYEAAEPGLGGRFLDAFDRVLDSIGDFPASHMLFDAGSEREYRAARVKPFSYIAVFEMRAGEPVVIAVEHLRRDSRYWRRRFSDGHEEE